MGQAYWIYKKIIESFRSFDQFGGDFDFHILDVP